MLPLGTQDYLQVQGKFVSHSLVELCLNQRYSLYNVANECPVEGLMQYRNVETNSVSKD